MSNIKTGTLALSHPIYFKKHLIYPRTVGRRRCTPEYALKISAICKKSELKGRKKRYAYASKYAKENKRQKSIKIKLEEIEEANINSILKVGYNKKTGTVSLLNYMRSTNFYLFTSTNKTKAADSILYK